MKGLVLAVIIGAILYFAIGTFICWAVSWAGDEKFSFNGVTFNFIAKWPWLFLKKSKIL